MHFRFEEGICGLCVWLLEPHGTDCTCVDRIFFVGINSDFWVDCAVEGNELGPFNEYTFKKRVYAENPFMKNWKNLVENIYTHTQCDLHRGEPKLGGILNAIFLFMVNWCKVIVCWTQNMVFSDDSVKY